MNDMRDRMVSWSICTCCMLCAANGECGDDCHDAEPLNKVSPGEHISLGAIEHSEECTEADREAGCDCDQLGFSWQSCDACGSNLGGDRFAAVLWLPEK